MRDFLRKYFHQNFLTKNSFIRKKSLENYFYEGFSKKKFVSQKILIVSIFCRNIHWTCEGFFSSINSLDPSSFPSSDPPHHLPHFWGTHFVDSTLSSISPTSPSVMPPSFSPSLIIFGGWCLRLSATLEAMRVQKL